MITLTPNQLEQSKFEEVASQFWSEDENTRSNLLKNHYHDVKFLHSLPVLIEFKKESLLDNYGAPSNTLITYNAILERNLYCINFLLRRAPSWWGVGFYDFKSSEVKGSPEVMATLENEDSSFGWLISCIKSVATGSDIEISDVIEEYLEDTSPPTPPNKATAVEFIPRRLPVLVYIQYPWVSMDINNAERKARRHTRRISFA